MKRLFLLTAAMMLSIMLSAQTQQGYVKTKGRMVDGKYIPGQGLKGATVTIQGRTSVLVEKDDGAFSFPVPAQIFMFQSVKKNGYELVDVDAIRKPYNYSTNPIYLVMETPEQQMEDLLDAQERISKTLREQLKKARAEIQQLKKDGRITEEQYQQRIAQLMADQQNNQQLIADMAKEYAQLDYDQMDELNQRISDAILNGRLTEAASLLRSKGDMKSRIAEIKREQQAEAQREDEIAQEQAELEASKAGTQKRLEDAASDCKKFFDLCKLNMQWDSAAYYIETRAELDSMNAEWQFDAANYFYRQNNFNRAERYYVKALEIRRRLAQGTPQTYEPAEAQTLNDLALLYSNTQRLTESEAMYLEALEIRRRLAQGNPQTYEPALASTLNNLANLYKDIQRIAESEAMHLEALEIRRRLAQGNPQAYEPDLASTLYNLALLYKDTQRLTESETMYLEALEIYRRLAQSNPQAYEPTVALTTNGLANLYYGIQRLAESEAMYLEALEIRKRLAQGNPQAYEPAIARTLNNLANLYKNTHRLTESERMHLEALEIWRRLAQGNPQAYEPALASTLNNLAVLYKATQRLTESETLYLEALEIRRRLAQGNPQAYEPAMAMTLNNLANLYNDTQRLTESETMYLEALEIRRRLAQGNPQAYEPDVAMTLNNLALHYSDTQRFAESKAMYLEALEIFRWLAQGNPQAYKPYMASTLGNYSYCSIFMKKYAEAEQLAREGLSVDSTQIWINSCLAAALLFQDKYAEAKTVYCQYKDELKDSFLQDFDDFEAAGVIPEERKTDVERIKKILMEEE